MLEIIYKEDRDLTNIEYANLASKANAGALPVEYFRKNLFNATTRTSKDLKRNKTIFDNGREAIQVTRSLHQKHRDVLSILYTDNLGVLKPKSDGSYQIRTNLYHIAKEMGYKNPSDATHLIKDFLFDMRHTDIVYKKDGKEVGHSLLGDYQYDKDSGEYHVNIPAMTAKMQILNYAVEIPKEINKKIVAIPNNLSKIKALVSYLLSNQGMKNGIGFDTVCDKLDIDDAANRSRFKKQVKDNTDLLRSFNIEYENDKFIYRQIESIKFQRGVKESEIISIIASEEEQKEIERYGFDKKLIIGKYLEHKTQSVLGTEEVVRSKIIDIEIRERETIKIMSNRPDEEIPVKIHEFCIVIEGGGRSQYLGYKNLQDLVNKFVHNESDEQAKILTL